MNGFHSKRKRRARSPCATLDGCGVGYLAYYGKKESDDVPSYKIVGIAGSGETTLRKGRGYWVYAQNDTNMTLKGVLPSDSSPSYSYPISRIYFRNDTSGEIRNITAAVEPPAGYNWAANNNKYRGWFGECNATYKGFPINDYFWDCTKKSYLIWWDPTAKSGNSEGEFRTYSYSSSNDLPSYKGVFVKFNYENISMIFVE